MTIPDITNSAGVCLVTRLPTRNYTRSDGRWKRREKYSYGHVGECGDPGVNEWFKSRSEGRGTSANRLRVPDGEGRGSGRGGQLTLDIQR